MKKITVGIVGLGRIGKMHAENLVSMQKYEVIVGADPFLTEELEVELKDIGVPYCTCNPEEVFTNPDIDAVVICSTTDTHSDFIIRAAKTGKDIFCEKPIDHDVSRIIKALDTVKEAGVILQIGFMRRFDRNHRRIRELVEQGAIGDVKMLKITSRDPLPPSLNYIKSSGGIYVDMMIHDFDMARFITGSEITEVFAVGDVLCDQEIGAAGDVDNTVVTIKFANGALGMIDNSRQLGFGHDQRIEVVGPKGCLTDSNELDSNVVYYNLDGYRGDKRPRTFIERYREAFLKELEAFAIAVQNRTAASVTGIDGLQSVLIAEAAVRSVKSGRMEPVEQITE